MEEKLYFTDENGKPELRMKGDHGEVTIVFAEKESNSSLKKEILRLIFQSYEDRISRTKPQKD